MSLPLMSFSDPWDTPSEPWRVCLPLPSLDSDPVNDGMVRTRLRSSMWVESKGSWSSALYLWRLFVQLSHGSVKHASRDDASTPSV